MATDNVLEIKNLHTYFYTDGGVIKAVDGVDVELRRGATLGIVGESGSGKSVTSLSVMGLLAGTKGKIADGEILLDGDDIVKLTKEQQRKLRGSKISMIFQEPMTSLNPVMKIGDQVAECVLQHEKISKKEALKKAEDMLRNELSFRELSTKMAVVLTERMKPELMTCHDIVATGRYPYTGRLGMLTREDEEKVEKAMRAVHAEELGGRDFNAISDGQRQRVLLARAICQEPEVIILDEPTSFLDIRHKLELLAILRRMAKEKGITVIMSLHEIDLAQKISDKIICVKGDAISHFGAPETIFREDIIRELYEIDNGSFDPCFGSIELPRPEGTPRVFVLAGGGTGIPVFRKLQKENVPFAAGVLYTNDIDYQLARILAMETVTEAPFQEISDEAFARACELMKSCERVIDTGVPVGMCNRRIEELRAEAKRLGKLAE